MMSDRDHLTDRDFSDVTDAETRSERRALIGVLGDAYRGVAAPEQPFASLLARHAAAPPVQPQSTLGGMRFIFRSRRRWQALAGLGAAAAVVLAVAGLLAGTAHTPTVSAQSILDRAQLASGAATPSGVSSYHMTVTISAHDAAKGDVAFQEEIWYGGAGLQRTDDRPAAGSAADKPSSGLIVNGNQETRYTTTRGQTEVVITAHDPAKSVADQALGNDLAAVVQQIASQNCGTATRQADTTVAGRPVYVIAVTHLGSCLPAGKAAPADAAGSVAAGTAAQQAGVTVWVDKQTFLPLKIDSTDGSASKMMEVTSVSYNLTPPAGTFTYTPPAGAIVHNCLTAPDLTCQTSAGRAQGAPKP